ncbi:MAG: hypothetical protein Q9209_000152 [Squamulea sp. 1 TL-2023]
MNLPPPNHNDSDNSEDEMAAAMGFSSFGTQHPAKRKKINHSMDREGSATGGNTLPLGNPRSRQGMEGMDGTTVGGRESVGGGSDPGVGRKVEEAADVLDARGGRLEGSLVGVESTDETSTLIQRQNELLERINDGLSSHSHPAMETTAHHLHQMISKPSTNTSMIHHIDTDTNTNPNISQANEALPPKEQRNKVSTKDGFGGHTWNEWRKGVRNERGDMVFYDASFVEDPWRNLKPKVGGGQG